MSKKQTKPQLKDLSARKDVKGGRKPGHKHQN